MGFEYPIGKVPLYSSTVYFSDCLSIEFPLSELPGVTTHYHEKYGTGKKSHVFRFRYSFSYSKETV